MISGQVKDHEGRLAVGIEVIILQFNPLYSGNQDPASREMEGIGRSRIGMFSSVVTHDLVAADFNFVAAFKIFCVTYHQAHGVGQ